MENLIASLVLIVFGVFNILYPRLMVKFQVWSQEVIMSAEYIPSPRTYAIIRGFGVFFVVLGLLFILGVFKISQSGFWPGFGLGTGNTPTTTDTASTTATTTPMNIKLYFYNPALDQGPGGAQCSRRGLVAVNRTIPETTTPVLDTVRVLLTGGLSETEKEQGITTEFPLAGVELKSAVVDSGTATLTFNDPQSKTSGGSCRAGILWFQIEATAKQFSNVKDVKFRPEELFQP